MPDRTEPMRDAPILFSGPRIRALLDGRKTETRRVIKPQPPSDARFTGIHYASYEPDSWFFNSPAGPIKVPIRYEPGDRLWVREQHALVPVSAYRRSESVQQAISPTDPDYATIYRADFDRSRGGILWRSPIHMPRWASRVTLLVRDVRVERLQEITSAGAIMEGCAARANSQTIDCDTQDPRDDFRNLWNSLHPKDHTWADNPWVTVTRFDVLRGDIDSPEVRRAGQQREARGDE